MIRPRFTISILSMRDLPTVMRCVSSVMANSRDYNLILTSNGAKDGIPEYFDALAKQCKFIKVIHNPTNLGFQQPNRIAFSQCTTNYFVMLNDDTEVPPGWLAALEQPFSRNPRAALTGPVGMPCSLKEDFNGYIGERVEYIEGACCCCKTEVIRKLGLFPHYLKFAYMEDQDLSLRVRQAGYSIHLVPFNLVHHRSNTSKHVPEARQWIAHNQREMLKRWASYFPNRKFEGEKDCTLTLVYIHVPQNRELVAQAKRFVETYKKFPPGMQHETLVIRQSKLPIDDSFLNHLPNVMFLTHNNEGWDIGGYIFAARHVKTDVMLCMGTSTHFHKPGWLVRVLESWQKHGPGFYGATASYQIRPHFNTTGFWCPPELLTGYQGRVSTREDRYAFEHGPDACWIQAARRGFPTKLVTWEGEHDWPEWRKPKDIHWRGNQSNVLFFWRLNAEYAVMPPGKKAAYEKMVNELTDPMFKEQNQGVAA